MYTIIIFFFLGFGIFFINRCKFYLKAKWFDSDILLSIPIGILSGLIGLLIAVSLPVSYNKSSRCENLSVYQVDNKIKAGNVKLKVIINYTKKSNSLLNYFAIDIIDSIQKTYIIQTPNKVFIIPL